MDDYCKALGETDCSGKLDAATHLPFARFDKNFRFNCYEDVDSTKTDPYACMEPNTRKISDHTECFEGTGAKCEKNNDLYDIAFTRCSGNFFLTL